MNSIVLKVIFEAALFIIAIVTAFLKHKRKDKTDKVLFYGAIAVAALTFILSFFFNTIPIPHIDRQSDYSAIVLSVDGGAKIEYRVSTYGDEWIEYTEPFKIEKNAVVYARAKSLWYKSEQNYRDVYVSENSLVYFGYADEPGDTIVSINAKYEYKDIGVNSNASNHYAGYEIKKSDITVIGTDIKGNEKNLDNFSYSPKVLKIGDNTINIKYTIVEDVFAESNIHITANEPALIELQAQYVGSTVYLNSELFADDFFVKAIHEDGSQEEIKDFTISPNRVEKDSNIITITKDGLTDEVEIMAIDKETIIANECESNDEINNANEIDVNVKYSGQIDESDDVDYYKLRLNEKGKIIIKMTHPKIDEDADFWETSFLDQNEEARVSVVSNGRGTESKSSAVRVMPGVYYIKVTDKVYHSSEKYTLMVVFEPENEYYENEPNDDLTNQAMVISLDKPYTGNLTTEDDIDYYKFSINDKRKVSIDFTHNKTSGTDPFWKVSLFGDSDGSILEFESTGENAKITSNCVRLPAGNYYVRVDNHYWSDLDYTFIINTKKESDESENEDNGDYTSATTIPLNSKILGNIQSENDVDFYKFELNADKEIKVIFEHTQSNSSDGFWRFELYSAETSGAIKNKDDNGTIEISGDSPEKMSFEWNSLSQGTYYLKVFKRYYNNGDYSITVS